ncbi:Protein trichome birefringence [Rhynchospora pubera]|uniref:Protein trichome birefringence n=1 Tax=Rhynchospora pubera TaxID=906938 RepID=A0AAV8DXM6_9POAL|nr:Protein trichome birefringence [Rhynchospora pubera]
MRMPRRKPSFLFTTNSTTSAASTRKPNRPELRRAAALLFSAILLGTLLYSADNIRFITIQSHITRSSPRQLSSLEAEANHASGPSDPIGIQSAADLFDGAKKRVLSLHKRDEKEKCDLFDGEWIYDSEREGDEKRRYPLYREDECVFLTEQVTCMRNGRKDDRYQRWRWQPRSCSLPRFDAKAFLERLRNKRMMFVGDSLNRNQWESMVCLVQSILPWDKKTLVKTGSLNVFRAEEYNATLEFYWAPFLVESNSDDPAMHSIRDRIIRPTSILKHGANWNDVDFLIFNTYIWWMNGPKMKVMRKGIFSRRSVKYEEVERIVAYRRVLRTWSKWVAEHIDPQKTTVFFMSMSPAHETVTWENPNAIRCAMETLPIRNSTGRIDVGTDWRLFTIAEDVIQSMRQVPVHYINITALSEVRKDAHTSVHTLRKGKVLTPEQQADPATYADCIHWCLPGLPDVWNEFLYAKIMSNM